MILEYELSFLKNQYWINMMIMHNTLLKINKMLQEIQININKSHFAQVTCIFSVIKDIEKKLNLKKPSRATYVIIIVLQYLKIVFSYASHLHRKCRMWNYCIYPCKHNKIYLIFPFSFERKHDSFNEKIACIQTWFAV